jgi:hypothetical protein
MGNQANSLDFQMTAQNKGLRNKLGLQIMMFPDVLFLTGFHQMCNKF